MTAQQDFLSDGSLTLRAVEPSDVDMLYRWENDSSQWATNNAFAPYSRKQLWDYANNYDGNIFATGNIRFIIDIADSGKSIGTVDLYDFDPRNGHAMIGIYIAKTERNKGRAQQAMKIALRYATECIGMRHVAALTTVTNDASIRMLEECGFTRCGTLRQWLKNGDTYCDAHLYQFSR